jgi:hypothetical protein
LCGIKWRVFQAYKAACVAKLLREFDIAEEVEELLLPKLENMVQQPLVQ